MDIGHGLMIGLIVLGVIFIAGVVFGSRATSSAINAALKSLPDLTATATATATGGSGSGTPLPIVVLILLAIGGAAYLTLRQPATATEAVPQAMPQAFAVQTLQARPTLAKAEPTLKIVPAVEPQVVPTVVPTVRYVPQTQPQPISTVPQVAPVPQSVPTSVPAFPPLEAPQREPVVSPILIGVTILVGVLVLGLCGYVVLMWRDARHATPADMRAQVSDQPERPATLRRQKQPRHRPRVRVSPIDPVVDLSVWGEALDHVPDDFQASK